MATTHQDTNVNQLVINKMTKQEYDNLSQVSETELYLVEEQVDSVVTQNSTNPIQSGAVYEALQDIGSAINDGTTLFTKNNKTIGIISANQALDKTIKIPNDIIMCKISDGIVYDSYITYTKIKQYLPDYPYYSDDLDWEIGGNPPTRANITADNYYLDVDTKHIFVADENLELLDITSSVVIQGDTNKLYCDVDDNKLYRHDGTNFIALTSEGKTYILSSNNENIRLTDSDGQTQDLSLNTLINGLSLGNSDPQDDDYIVSQYVNGTSLGINTYHRRPLSKFWNWIKSKLGIGTNDGTFLRKDGTWATPTSTIYLGVATGNSLIAFIKTKISNGYKVGFLTAQGSSVNGCPDSTNVWIIQYQCDTNIGNAIQLMSWCYGSAWAICKGYAWNNNNNEPSWKNVAYAEDYVAKAGDTMSGNLTTPALKISGGRVQGSGDDEGIVIAPSSNNYAALTLAAGGDPQTAAGKYHSTFYLQATGSYNMFWRASVNGSNYDIQHPKKSGTIALTSDIQQNTWRPLGTGASDACAGNDSRLSNSRPASDVYAWAKASTKPSYTASEVGAQSATALTASKTHTGSSCSVTCYKYGRVVTAHITLYGNYTIYIDSIYRPASTVYFFMLNSDSSSSGIFSNGNTFIGSIGTDGLVQGKYPRNSSYNYYGTATYITAS